MFREPKPGYHDLIELIRELNRSYPPIAEVERADHAVAVEPMLIPELAPHETGGAVDVVGASHPSRNSACFGLQVLIVPSAFSLAPETWARVSEFVQGGGTLLEMRHSGFPAAAPA